MVCECVVHKDPSKRKQRSGIEKQCERERPREVNMDVYLSGLKRLDMFSHVSVVSA